MDHLEALLCEHSPPTEILIDNDTFHSKLFRHFLNEWVIGPLCSDTPEASSLGPDIDSLKNTSVDKSSDEEAAVIPLPRSTQHKRPAPDCHIWNHEIMAESSGNEMQTDLPIATDNSTRHHCYRR